MSGGYAVGVDIGGTFTDFVLLDEDSGSLRLHKKLTTPDDPARGAVEGLEELLEAAGGISLADCSTLVHGTTLVTNALIERSGVKTALLTTAGFGDILEMGREQRYDIYDLFLEYPEPLVPRRWRVEVDERMTRDGEPLRVPDPETIRGLLEDLLGEGVEAVAVCFLHSYRNPAHEGAVADAIRRDYPQLSVSASSEVVPEIREFERTSTTVCNAYVQPLVDRYLGRLEEELGARGFGGRFLLMQSSGGLAAPETVRRFPVRLLESGPAGGAAVAAFLGRALDVPELVSFDMGGTTAKVCLVRGGEPDLAAEMEAARVHRFKKGSGITVKAPVVDLIEIGAGGGSIAGSDRLGLLRVGPRSAGAEPGPASYGLGGERPTVTDACLLLGYFDPDYFLGGTMPLDLPAAERALKGLGRELGLSTTEAAWGVYGVVCENMASAARVHIIEKGQDPRRFPMIAFGGAGPAHAARVARALGAPEVVVPPVSGVASALGFLVTPASFEFSRSRPGELRSLPWEEVASLYNDMEEKARGTLAASGVSPGSVRLERRAEMRLSGQFHDIEVPVPEGPLTEETARLMGEAFETEYRRLFHAVPPGYEPMVLNWRLRASGPKPRLRLQDVAASLAGADGTTDPSASARSLGLPKGRRDAYFPEAGGYVDTPVYDRYELGDGFSASGPVIIEEKESTVVANPGDILGVDGLGNIRIQIGGKRVSEQRFDPVSLEILWSRLITVTEECWITIHRTAFSMIIGEAQDFGCELMDARGETLAHSPRSMPVFNLTLPRAVKSLLEFFPPETLEEGDVLITNDPWICAGHLFDVAVVTPVFRGGGIVGLVGSIAHCSDIGGTRDTMSVREVYEEGLQIPPMKLYRRGEANDDLLRLLRQNVRTGDMVIGDIHAQVGANGVAAERLVAFMDEYGLDDLSGLAKVVQDRAERAMREAIAAVPDGEYAGSAGFDGVGEPMELPVRAVVEGDEITVDWSGAPDQLERGGINCTLSYTEAHTAYALKCILTPEVPSNAGCFRPIRVVAPEGSILNCDYPASVNQRTVTGWACAPAVFGALAEALPDDVQAFTGLPMGAGAYGRDAEGRTFNDHLFQGGGQGASAHGDGKSALLFPTSAANTSVEMFETRTPLVVERKELIPDSGGAGRHRGGLGQRVQVRRADDVGGTALMGIHPQGMLVDIPGLFGGRPGQRTGVRLEEDGTVAENEDLGSLVELRRTSQLLTIELAGGSGYGDPAERPIEAVQADLDAGLISAEGAQDYGCEVDASGGVHRLPDGNRE